MDTPRIPSRSEQFRALLPVLALGAICLVLSSLDQCTRGPSLTAMVLANLNNLV